MQSHLPISISPHILSRSEHCVSRGLISENALKVLYRLKKSGFCGYLVGGGVRDLLLGREPKDFDIATDAHPEQVHELFRNCRLIGRRFRLAHVHFGREIIEVATFRGNTEGASGDRQVENGLIVRDNTFGTIEEDALRRDFTVNALYYDIRDFSVIDYAGGIADLNAGLLRLIGDPSTRFREDPVRMLRAVRFAAKLGFRIEQACEQAVMEMASLLQDMPAARLYEEVLKLFLAGSALQAFEGLRHYGLFQHLFAATEEALQAELEGFPLVFLAKALANTDERVAQQKPVTPVFILAALLWEPVRLLGEEKQADGMDAVQALQVAGAEITARQSKQVTLPRRIAYPMRDIWMMQPRFLRRAGKRPLRLLQHPRFRAAYDFLLLRCQAGEADSELGRWWTDLVESKGVSPASSEPGKRRSRSGARRRGKAKASVAN